MKPDKDQLIRVTEHLFYKATSFLHKDKRIDTMRYGQKFCGGKWPKLTELYLKLFQEEYEAHSAGADVDACYKCFIKLSELGLCPSVAHYKINGLELNEIIIEEES